MFRTFVLERAERIRTLVATRVHADQRGRAGPRCSTRRSRWPRKQAGGPIGLLEVGASAGLLLGMDRYSYRYQTEQAGQIAAGPARAAARAALRAAAGAGREAAADPASGCRSAAKRRAGPRRRWTSTDEEELRVAGGVHLADQPERLRLFGRPRRARRQEAARAGDGRRGDRSRRGGRADPPRTAAGGARRATSLRVSDRARRSFLAALDAAGRPAAAVVGEPGVARGGPGSPDRPDLATGAGDPRVHQWVGGSRVTIALARPRGTANVHWKSAERRIAGARPDRSCTAKRYWRVESQREGGRPSPGACDRARSASKFARSSVANIARSTHAASAASSPARSSPAGHLGKSSRRSRTTPAGAGRCDASRPSGPGRTISPVSSRSSRATADGVRLAGLDPAAGQRPQPAARLVGALRTSNSRPAASWTTAPTHLIIGTSEPVTNTQRSRCGRMSTPLCPKSGTRLPSSRVGAVQRFSGTGQQPDHAMDTE